MDDLVQPYEDYYARVEGREIISNLAKAARLATMISTMRPDIDNPDEYVRNTTSRAFAVTVMYASCYTQMIMFNTWISFTWWRNETYRVEGHQAVCVVKEILPEFFCNFWIRRLALDKRNHAQVVEITEELANKVGVTEILVRIVDDLKDVQKILLNLGNLKFRISLSIKHIWFSLTSFRRYWC